ncbi:hypothetical protein B5F14_06075 [Faecalitalea cylindroides]|uniref:Uncharacterized protein n=1 Tax=Faecalitalea cylindroides TaxID=39483 RepID=A0A1Y4LZ11_9FIRM|nr:hypothetical protein B5F14_06075 [Faecalitalea cylindroides]
MGKSPIEVFNFFHDYSNILEKLEIKEIDSESIDLTVNLIKNKQSKILTAGDYSTTITTGQWNLVIHFKKCRFQCPF